MTLLHAYALTGLAAAITPIVIYLILRRRKSEIPWGASYLLRLTLRSRRKSSVWKQMVVLGLRCAILAVAALLLALPVTDNDSPNYRVPAMPAGPVHRAILVDHSSSMSAEDLDGTRLSRMREALQILLKSQRQGDLASIVNMVDPSVASVMSWTVPGQVPDDLMRRLMLHFVPRESNVDISAPLAAAVTKLALSSGTDSELYILSDFPRELGKSLGRLDWFPEAISRLDARVIPVNLAPADAAEQSNVVVESLAAGTDMAVAGVPLTFTVGLTHHADSEASTRLDFLIDGERAISRDITLKANERRPVTVSLTLQEPGSSVVKVVAQRSRLERGRTRSLSLLVRESLRVWLVAEEPAGKNPDDMGEGEFIRRALRRYPHAFQVNEVRMFDLTTPIPSDVDAIIICSFQRALSGAKEPLSDFLRSGGGLIVATGKGSPLAGLSACLEELLPSPLEKPARTDSDPKMFSLASSELSESASLLLRETVNGEDSDWGRVRYYNHAMFRDWTPPEGIVLRLASADPLLYHTPAGRGHFYFFASSLGVSWNSLPMRQCFLPFLLRLTQAAARGRTPERNLAPGGTLFMAWPSEALIKVSDPDTGETKTEAKTMHLSDKHFAVFEQLEEAGLYELRDERGNEDHFTVKASVVESDLRSLRPNRSEQLSAVLQAPIHHGWEEAVRARGASDAFHELWPILLGLLTGLYLFECWFVRSL